MSNNIAVWTERTGSPSEDVKNAMREYKEQYQMSYNPAVSKDHSDITVLYHRDEDGFGSAYAVWKKYGDTVTYISVQYGEAVPHIPEGTKILYILDFSYDRATCDCLANQYDLQVIDHHKTAKKELEGAEYAIFDTSHSGCVLTWKHLFPDADTPPILKYVEDRDLWKFELYRSGEVNLYIASLAEDFLVWEYFLLGTALTSGSAIKSFRDAQIEKVVASARYDTFLGHKVVVANCTANVSETGAMLIRKFSRAAFSITYADRRDGKRSYSLRSIAFDVSEVAKQFGGGGHPRAAGFTMQAPLWDTPILVLGLAERHEALVSVAIGVRPPEEELTEDSPSAFTGIDHEQG